MGAKQARKHAQKMTKLREGRSQRVSKRIDNTDRRSSQKSQRSTSAIRMERMRSQKLQRDRDGRVIGGAFQSSEAECGKVARVQPDRRWFENTRVIGQKQLTHFREEMAKQVQNDPYKVVLRRNLVPMGLLNAGKNEKEQVRTLLDRESYSDTFGDKARRKRPTLSVTSLDEMVAQAQQEALKYDASKDADHVKATTDDDGCGVVADPFMRAGQSNRIWSELYKVIDSSDVLIQVLDARDPQGTRCLHIERHLREREPHKHMVIVLNKCDLVPTWAVARWIKVLSKDWPTLAFHATLSKGKSFGKGALIALLRQFATLHKDRRSVSVGLIGYPNVGKSSVINTLRDKRVCRTAPVPGETKVWQYITLFQRVFLIDCPGVVYDGTKDTHVDTVLKGVVMVEKVDEPASYAADILRRVKARDITRAYGIPEWENADDFLEKFARKRGKLVKGGEPDINAVGRLLLADYMRGRLPWFVAPPFETELERQKYLAKRRKQAALADEGTDAAVAPVAAA